MKKARTFANVWEAIEDSPEEAATMTMRSNMMSAIKVKVHGRDRRRPGQAAGSASRSLV